MKNTFDMLLGKINRILALRGVILSMFLAISGMSFSQTYTNSDFNQVNNIRYGLYNVCDSIWLTEPTRKSPVDAFEDLNIYKANHLLDNCMQIQAKGKARLDLSDKWKGENKVAPTVEIDTIILSRMSREIVRGWLDYTNAGVEPSPLRAYLPFIGLGMVEIKTDTIYNWQNEYRFERTKQFSETIYKEIEKPFQFIRDSIVSATSTEVRVRTFATQKHCVSYYLDNKIYDENASCNPGQVILDGITAWRHTKTITGLNPDTNYLLRVQGTAENGEINLIEFDIITTK